MKHDGLMSHPLPTSSSPTGEAGRAGGSDPRASMRLANLPQLTPDQYERVLQQVTSDFFVNDEQFRKAVVLREVRKVVLGWGAAIGLTSVVAVATLYFNARDTLTQTVSTELSRAVKDHVSTRSELLNESVKSLTNTAIGQIVHVQKELESAQAALDRAQQQLAVANQQSADLQRRIASISDTLGLVQQNAAWLGDSQNAERVAGFIRTLSSERNAKAIGDLLARIDRLEAAQIETQIAQRANILEDTHRKALEISRLLDNLPKEQVNKLRSQPPTKSGPHAFDKWDAYIRGADPPK